MSESVFTPYADPALLLNAPNFPKIEEGNYVAQIMEAIKIARERFEMVKSNPEAATYQNTITAMHHCDTELEEVLSVFYTLLSAESNDAMQAMAQEIGPMTAEFSNDVGLDPVIFERIDKYSSEAHSF